MERLVLFTKAQSVSILATGVDFLVTLMLVKGLDAPYLAGSATGTLLGGLTHFMMSRTWVFNAQEKKWSAQLTRYVLVWIGNLVLNVAGLYLLTRLTGQAYYLINKIFIAIGVAVFYNYVLQKRYVFK